MGIRITRTSVPSSSVGGDLSGTLPNPTVAKSAASTWGVYNVTPVARPAAYTLTFATAGSRTLPADTATSVATTASTQTTPFGFSTQAQADAIVTAVNALLVDVDGTKKVLKQVIADLILQGHLQ